MSRDGPFLMQYLLLMLGSAAGLLQTARPSGATRACILMTAKGSVVPTKGIDAGDSECMLRAELDKMQNELLQSQAARKSAEEQLELLKKELAELQTASVPPTPQVMSADSSDDMVSMAFDAVDEDGNGVLDIDEFRKGYALLNGDAVARVFEAIDENGKIGTRPQPR